MSHYKANLRDIEFCLFDLLGRDKVMGLAPYGEVDRDTSMGMLEEVKRLCENDLAHPLLKAIASERFLIRKLAMSHCLKVLRSHTRRMLMASGGVLMHQLNLVE